MPQRQHKPFRGPLWRMFAIALLVIIAMLVVISWPELFAGRQQREARAGLIAALAGAATPAELQSAAIIYKYPDGSWIATKYDDSHRWPGYSVSMALCSDGAWYESDVHYCGEFGYYARVRHDLADWQRRLDHPSRTEEDRVFIREMMASLAEQLPTLSFAPLAEAETLAAAQQALLDLGFRPVRISATPALRGPLEWPPPPEPEFGDSTDPGGGDEG